MKMSTKPANKPISLPFAVLPRELLKTPTLRELQPAEPPVNYQLMHITEISEEKPGTYSRAMTNVLSVMQDRDDASLVYLLRGDGGCVQLFIGVAEASKGSADCHEAIKSLRSAAYGHLPGVQLVDKTLPDTLDYQHYGIAMGVPTAQQDQDKSDDIDFQGIERLVRAMQQSGNQWQLTLIARPMPRVNVHERIDQAMQLASRAATLSKTTLQVSANSGSQTNTSVSHSASATSNESVTDQRGKNESGTQSRNKGGSSGDSNNSNNTSQSTSSTAGTNTSRSETRGTSDTKGTSESYSRGDTSGESSTTNLEVHDKWNQALLTHLEEYLLPRLRKGLNKGMFQCACYLAASDASTYKLLAGEVKSTFQGTIETPSPIEIYPLKPNPKQLSSLFQLPFSDQGFAAEKSLTHSLYPFGKAGNPQISSLLNAEEVALLASLPRQEVPGIVRRKNVEFALSLPDVPEDCALALGHLIDYGRTLDQLIKLDRRELDKHVFITGVTGAGKTTTCMKLLLESGLPFLVIEPAKTEYRALLNSDTDKETDCYRPGEDLFNTLRINPFQLVHRQQKLTAQISLILATLCSAFPMEASMPQLVEMAIIRAYEAYGWDVQRNANDLYLDPWQPDSEAWPTFSDMVEQLDYIIPEQKMGKEFEEKYRGSLVSRLSALTKGVMGAILNCRYSTDFQEVVNRNVIIELEGLPHPEHKALLMGLIMGRIADAMKARHQEQAGHRHLTLIEEAHRLLARPEPGESDSRKNAVETFTNLLAEIRKYGEGLIIADQIPNKLVSDVIKNTHVKIVHRLYAEDDRRTLGEAMMLNEEQRGFLPNLQTGEAIVYRGGWHRSARVKILEKIKTDGMPVSDEELQRQSELLFHRQRQALYPRMAQDWPQATAAQWADFVARSRTLLGLLFKAAHAKDQPGNHAVRYRNLVTSDIRKICEEYGEQTFDLMRWLLNDTKPAVRDEKHQEKPGTSPNHWDTSDSEAVAALLRECQLRECQRTSLANPAVKDSESTPVTDSRDFRKTFDRISLFRFF